MNSEDYFITLTSGFLKKLNTDTGQILYNQRINIPKNLDEWDKDQQLSLIQFYFEKNIAKCFPSFRDFWLNYETSTNI
jgi:hypothetical protein